MEQMEAESVRELESRQTLYDRARTIHSLKLLLRHLQDTRGREEIHSEPSETMSVS